MCFINRHGRILLFVVAAFALVAQPAHSQQQQPPYYTGEGGKGIRLAVLEPVGNGLSADEQWMLSLVQGSITGDFNKYSAMTIIDRQNLEKILAEWEESMSGNYSDADRVKIGNLTNASHILTGSISKTANTIMLELTVTDVASGVRKASYSPTPVSLSALEDLSAIKAASADLLRQLGVGLTDAALGELKRAATTERIRGETMLARGITAQRQGTEVAALSYFYQAAAFDPSLVEASSRSSIMFANISSGNIGEDARNDIAWRKNWVVRLKETEETFYALIDAADPPYSLYYSTDIRKGKIDYKKETLDLSIDITLKANNAWFNALNKSLKAADAVLDGLNATNRKKDWGLSGWPGNGVSNTNPFSSSKRYDIKVVFELVNERGTAIGSKTVRLNPSFRITRNSNDKMIAKFTESSQETVKFDGVKADDISDNLTIRIASVNGASPESARFAISAISLSAPPSKSVSTPEQMGLPTKQPASHPEASSFNPSAVYVFSGVSTVDSRGYNDEKRHGSRLLGGIGYDLHGTAETRSTFGAGAFLGGGIYGEEISSFIIGFEVKNLFWLVEKRLAVPVSVGFDMQTLYSDVEKRLAAGFIDNMSASDKVSSSKLDIYMHKYDLRPTIGLQVVINRKISICAGYAYNLNLFPLDWYVYYKIPGKSYGSKDKGKKYDVPKEYSPLQDVKENFLGIPGALRVSLNIHIDN